MSIQDLEEWNHIEVYESGKQDLAMLMLFHFESELPEHIARWLRVQKEVAQEHIKEAEEKQL